LRLRDSYDIPEDVAAGSHSPSFGNFLWSWFGDTYAVTHGELDLTFLDDLTPEELSLARELIRRNLRLKRNHIIEGASALHDVDAAPILLKMFHEEPDISRRLTLAGALWKINRDHVFVECLDEAKATHGGIFAFRHLLQVLWLDDERAVDFLIDLLNAKEWMTQSMTLGLLNELEFGRRMGIPAREMPHQPADYRKMRADPAFRAQMVSAIHKRNAESKNGW
jgi:hypothetical protein